MGVFNTFCITFFFGVIAHLLEYFLGTNFSRNFFQQNLISILATLLAINIAVLPIVLTRMVAIDPNMSNFLNSKKEIRKSINEQVVLIGAALILSMLSSKSDYTIYPELIGHAISVLFITIFSYAIYILRDTANALIDIH